MESHSFEEYMEALKKAGPKGRQNIIYRAINDPNLSISDFTKLSDYATEKDIHSIKNNEYTR